MRGEELVVNEALKVRALPEGSYDKLLEFLRLYRDAIQIVVDRIWGINEKLSWKKLHKLFYSDLVSMSFRAHHAKEIYVNAKSLMDSAKNNGGRKPVLRKLSAKIDKYDYKLDLDNMVLTLKLHNDYEVKLRLITSRERVEKFRGWSNYELVVKYDEGVFWVSIYFKRIVKLLKPRTVMAIDLNFGNVTLAAYTLDGRRVRLKKLNTPHKKILTHKIWIEKIQKRYPKSWRFIKNVRKAIERHGKRIKNISWDYAHKTGNTIAKLALKHNSVIILENLEKLKENNKKGREFNKKLGLWFYRRIQFCIEYEAMERDLEVVKVNPRGTSSKCPRCGGRLVEDGYRVLRCRKCDFVGDRDVTATINIYVVKVNPRGTSSKCPRCGGRLVEDGYRVLRCRKCDFVGDRDVTATINIYKKYISKHSRCGVFGVAPNAPKPDENPSGMQGNKNEAMTTES